MQDRKRQWRADWKGLNLDFGFTIPAKCGVQNCFCGVSLSAEASQAVMPVAVKGIMVGTAENCNEARLEHNVAQSVQDDTIK